MIGTTQLPDVFRACACAFLARWLSPLLKGRSYVVFIFSNRRLAWRLCGRFTDVACGTTSRVLIELVTTFCVLQRRYVKHDCCTKCGRPLTWLWFNFSRRQRSSRGYIICCSNRLRQIYLSLISGENTVAATDTPDRQGQCNSSITVDGGFGWDVVRCP